MGVWDHYTTGGSSPGLNCRSPYVTPNSPKGWPVIDEATDFKFGMQLGFAKVYHQIPLEEKVGVALG